MWLEADEPQAWILGNPLPQGSPPTDQLARMSKIANTIGGIVHTQSVELVGIEWASARSKGARSVELHALYYLIIQTLEEQHVKYYHAPPTKLKKFATGSGTATKEAMLTHALLDDAGIPMGRKKNEQFDLADAYWAARWAITEAQRSTSAG